MKQNNKQAPTPKLRFPEFRDGRWEDRPFSDLYEFKPTNSLSRDKLNYDAGDAKNVHYGDIHVRFPERFEVDKVRVPFVNASESLDKIDSDSYCREGDIIFADASEDLADIGKSIEIVALGDTLLLSGTHTILARQRKPRLVVGFGAYLFRSTRIRDQIKREAQGSKVFGISPSRLSKIKVCLPSEHAEQKKIADCMSSLDEVIAVQARKVEALKDHKNGLMQQLFPRGGKAVPSLQYPEFRRIGSWTKRRIAELLSKVSKAVTVQETRMYREIGIRSHGKGIFHKDPTDGKTIESKRVFWVEQDALVLNIVFAWEQAVATTTKVEEGMIASHRFPMYVAKPGMCDVRYMKYLFLTNEGKHLLGLASPGGAGRNRTLGQEHFESLEVLLPVNVEEQSKIADSLSAIENLIEVNTRKLHALKTHKAGLMQHLFPTSAEETEA